LTILECDALDRDQLHRLFRIELRNRWAMQGDDRPFGITVHCSGSDIVLTVTPPELARESGVRRIPRKDAHGEVGTRLLVLQAMELLYEIEQEQLLDAPVPDEPEQPGAEPPKSHRRNRENTRLMSVV